ncbi:MAG: hypothetical protein CLLPBCKN_007068 [Chroococcidiopsis cubana SAG 39.79]|uniref:Uncharacterized protein n=1 Tax=Chroococcidiopsis cubana SAG 39.79 TaxID=388085 RepID=A0AB37UCR3_9CYAN|nr:hypothetical protein [Chroococcidiopsis cubana]MDZ4877633.1 hypothetical protein [Chroococcidiopsis cubana SAG 39.79]PSB55071.1 hypothetical protein C7B79_34015 [Chroococcidiopsis cubana CCALA 043]RUT05328.1 hypothetical protein DSM107010_56000 [Chroococcidiopsis cubana SAG 39.79]
MLKQILTGSFILVVFLVNGEATRAEARATLLLSQTQTEHSTTEPPTDTITAPGSDGATPDSSNPKPPEEPQSTPTPDNALTRPSPDRAETSTDTTACEDIPLARPAGGATRERLQAIEQCDSNRMTKEAKRRDTRGGYRGRR